MIQSLPKIRRKQDKTITTSQLQQVLESWFLHIGGRDLNEQFAKLANEQPENGAACASAMGPTHFFFVLLFAIVRNAVLPGQKMELAVQNAHRSSPVHTTKRDTIKVSEKFTNVLMKACKKYRDMCDDPKTLGKFLSKARSVIACVKLLVDYI